MGFLHNLWDETLAGPAPEMGLGKLRKYNSLTAAAAAATWSPVVTEDVPISRSITIVRTNSNFRTTTTSDPASSSVPCSPRSPETPGGDFKKLTRRKSVGAVESSAYRSPNINDWVIMIYGCFGSLLREEVRCFCFENHSVEAEGLRSLYLRQHRFQLPQGIIISYCMMMPGSLAAD